MGKYQALLWLWCRPAVTAPIQPLAWELPYVAGVALKRQKKKKTKKDRILHCHPAFIIYPGNALKAKLTHTVTSMNKTEYSPHYNKIDAGVQYN